MTNEQYVTLHRRDDVRALALKRAPEGVDLRWCLQQIEGLQLAERKLPRWAAAEGLWFPPRLSMEQCSSEATASYKRMLVERLLPEVERTEMTDLTGGFGVDFSYIAPLFRTATYVERLSHLCDVARHNLPLLGLPEARVLCDEADAYLSADHRLSLLFLDPARRDTVGRKTVAIADCTPDVAQLHDRLLEQASVVLIKLSPMLDIRDALRALPSVSEVHVVGAQGECKDLLLVLQRGAHEVTYHCADLGATPSLVVAKETERHTAPRVTDGVGAYLYEPNACVLKAGLQDVLCERYGVGKLHAMSHLFTSDEAVAAFPGRGFRVEQVGDFSKQGVRQLLADVRQANLTIRNFPSTVADLRRQLTLKEGGDVYLFATTLADGRHALIRCRKI
ncbi:MAG: hypothetical protein HUK02_02385 [Bacteroidaceae bacterium]|nr:hypothetical protein [Bacteroidaceae bacterium]